MQLTRVVSVAIAAVLFSVAGQAATRFVAVDGRYDNDGTLASPWSLERAAEAAGPGDTVEIRGGTYAAVLHPERSGSASARLVFRAYSGETPLIAGAGPDDVPVEIVTDYVTVDGLAIGKSVAGRGRQHNVRISGDNAVVRNCRIVGADPVGRRQAGVRETGIYIDKPSVGTLIENCEIAGLSHVGVHVGEGTSRVVIRDNLIRDHYMDAVRFNHSDGRLRESLVENNRLYGSIVSDGIQFNGDFGSPTFPDDTSNCGTVIRNNDIHDNAENGIDLKGTCRIVVEGNRIYGNRGDNDGNYDNPPTCGSAPPDRCGGFGGVMQGGNTRSRDIIVRRNVIYDNRGGIDVADTGWAVYNNTIVANNRDYTGSDSTFRATGKPYFAGVFVRDTGATVAVKNNIVGNHRDVELRAAGAGIAGDLDGNMYFSAAEPQFSYVTNPWSGVDFEHWQQSLAGWGAPAGNEARSFVAGSAGFVAAPGYPVAGDEADFRLGAASPAVDGGGALTRTASGRIGNRRCRRECPLFQRRPRHRRWRHRPDCRYRRGCEGRGRRLHRGSDNAGSAADLDIRRRRPSGLQRRGPGRGRI